jgi:hypothetical protein
MTAVVIAATSAGDADGEIESSTGRRLDAG